MATYLRGGGHTQRNHRTQAIHCENNWFSEGLINDGVRNCMNVKPTSEHRDVITHFKFSIQITTPWVGTIIHFPLPLKRMPEAITSQLKQGNL